MRLLVGYLLLAAGGIAAVRCNSPLLGLAALVAGIIGALILAARQEDEGDARQE